MSNSYSYQERMDALILALKEISSPFPVSTSPTDRLMEIALIAKSALNIWDGKPKNWGSKPIRDVWEACISCGAIHVPYRPGGDPSADTEAKS